MQRQELAEARSAWLELLNSKELTFLTYLLQNRGMIRPILALSEDYVSAAEARAMGISAVHNSLIFQDLVEKYITGTTTLWRLTDKGIKLKKALLTFLDTIKEVV